MNARTFVALFALSTLLTAGTALATPVGTAKALGDYRPFWQTQFASYAHRRHAHARHGVTTHTSAAMTTVPARASAPITPEPAVTHAASAVRTTNAPTTTTAPAPAPTMQSHALHYARHASVDRWSLPKTDVHKYITN